MEEFFTGDPHFWHTNIIGFCNRPFDNILEMNEVIATNWNSRVKPGDKIYIDGDFALKTSIYNIRNLLKRLNGKKYFILGDHDKQIWKCSDLLEEITPLKNIVIDKIPITICHWCMRVWSKSHYNAWHLFAHSHGKLEAIGKSHDIGVDNNGFFPRSFEELRIIMASKPDNINYIKNRSRK